MTSATYRQSSVCPPELLAKDPENRWLARGARFRLPYEFIRDNLLARFVDQAIRRSFPSNPGSRAGFGKRFHEKTANNFLGEFAYVPDTVPEKMYRRSLYTYHKRTIPPPASLVFDAPMRDNCEVRRSRTSTPLQALDLLNDQQALEAARVLAQRLLADQNLKNDKDRIAEGFLRIMGRQPERAELSTLSSLFDEENKRYRAKPEAARTLLSVGRFPFEKNLDPAEQAALMLTLSAVFNLDEAMSKT